MMDHHGTARPSTMMLVLVTTAYFLVVSSVTVESSSSSAALLLSPAEISSRPTDKTLANTIDTSEDECKSIFPSVYFLLWHPVRLCPAIGFYHDGIEDDGGSEGKCVHFHLTRSIESLAFCWMFSFEDDPAEQISDVTRVWSLSPLHQLPASLWAGHRQLCEWRLCRAALFNLISWFRDVDARWVSPTWNAQPGLVTFTELIARLTNVSRKGKSKLVVAVC